MKLFCHVTTKSRAKSRFSRLKNRLLVLAVCSLLPTYAFFLLLQWNIVCLNLDIQLQLDKLVSLYCLVFKIREIPYIEPLKQCQEFHEGHAFGDLCPALCSNQITTFSCHSMHKGKSTVFTAVWNNALVVLKNPKTKAEYIPIEGTSYNSTSEFPSYEEFTEMVVQSVSMNFGISADNLLSKLYPFVDFHKVITKSQMVNLWELSQDNEYVSLMFYNHSSVFPKILGSCGTFYAMEYAKPIPSIDNLFSSSVEHLGERVQAAKLIIDLLDVLESSFPQPLHMCDVKLEHFGILRGRAVLLDVDTVFPKHIIDQSVADGRHCSEHADCDFFDCRSLCNESLHICDIPVVNNNLQLICQKVFLESELLVNKHLPSAVNAILRDCASPFSSDGRKAASVQSLKELHYFFDEFLKSEQF